MAEPGEQGGIFPPMPPVPSAEEIYRAFLVQPRAAIDFFESLGIRVTWNWQADAQVARDIAFYVSKVTEVDVLAAIKEEIARGLELGISRAQFRTFLRGRLAQLGWLAAREVAGPDGETAVVDLSTPFRMDTIFRTNTQSAYNAGRYSTQLQYAHAAPYWQYIAVMDSRTRLTHAEMNGTVFLATDAIWSTIYPPCGFNCRCRVRAMTKESFDRSGLALSDGATFELPDGFPDEGFGGNPVNPMTVLAALSQRTAEAQQRAARSL